MNTSRFSKVTSRKGTYSIQFEGTDMLFKRTGLDPFWVADMDFETSDAVTKSIAKRLDNKIFGYTMTTDENFYTPIINWWHNRFNIQLQRADIHIAPTVMFIISEYIRLFTKPGEPVLYTSPSYNGFLKVIDNNQRMHLQAPLYFDNSYQLDMSAFESLCARDDVNLYIHCNPHNPTGKVWTHEENAQIIDICRKYNVTLISDEIHMDFIRNTTFDSMVNHLQPGDSCLVTTGLGKTFNLASLPIAYFITKDHEMMKRLNDKMHAELCLITGNSLTLAAVSGAYTDGHEWVRELNEYIGENMKFVKSYIDEHLSDYLMFHIPDATYLCWIGFDKSGFEPSTVHQAFIDVGNIAVVPGSEYGSDWDHYFRLNVACRRERLKEGLDAIRKTFAHLKKITSP